MKRIAEARSLPVVGPSTVGTVLISWGEEGDAFLAEAYRRMSVENDNLACLASMLEDIYGRVGVASDVVRSVAVMIYAALAAQTDANEIRRIFALKLAS